MLHARGSSVKESHGCVVTVDLHLKKYTGQDMMIGKNPVGGILALGNAEKEILFWDF